MLELLPVIWQKILPPKSKLLVIASWLYNSIRIYTQCRLCSNLREGTCRRTLKRCYLVQVLLFPNIDTAPHSFHKQSRGKRRPLHKLCIETDVLVTDTESYGHLFIAFVNKEWHNSVRNSKAYNCFCIMGSNHCLVTAKVKNSLKNI